MGVLMRLVIIGGGVAGSEAAFAARKYDRTAEIYLIQKQNYPQYSPCGLPYALANDITNFNDLIIFPKEFYEKQGIKILLGTEVKEIMPSDNYILLENNEKIEYDSIILSTGSYSTKLNIDGIDKKGVFFIKNLDETKELSEYINESKKAIVIGFGIIALEGAYALKKRGLDVTIIARKPRPMRQSLDADMGEIVIEYLKQKGINLILGKEISKIEGDEKAKGIIVDNTFYPSDIILIAIGVNSNTSLAVESGIEVNGGIITNNNLQTSVKNIYACGDCASVTDFFTGKLIPSNLGTNAVRQGKVAGINSVGGDLKFDPVINATITEVFDLKIGAFGFTEDQLIEKGIEYAKAKYKGKSKAEYYPGAKDIFVKLLSNLEGKIIGVQIIGEEGVFARTLAMAFAVQKGMTIEELSKSENCYCPPVSPTIDPLQICAELLLKRLKK